MLRLTFAYHPADPLFWYVEADVTPQNIRRQFFPPSVWRQLRAGANLAKQCGADVLEASEQAGCLRAVRTRRRYPLHLAFVVGWERVKQREDRPVARVGCLIVQLEVVLGNGDNMARISASV